MTVFHGWPEVIFILALASKHLAVASSSSEGKDVGTFFQLDLNLCYLGIVGPAFLVTDC